MTNIDIEWPLDGNVKLSVERKAGDIFVIKDLGSDRELTLSWNHQIGTGWSRLLFDGQDIETESYMGYVGLMDSVVEQLGDKGVGIVILDEEF
jgi:hypothetical protein